MWLWERVIGSGELSANTPITRPLNEHKLVRLTAAILNWLLRLLQQQTTHRILNGKLFSFNLTYTPFLWVPRSKPVFLWTAARLSPKNNHSGCEQIITTLINILRLFPYHVHLVDVQLTLSDLIPIHILHSANFCYVCLWQFWIFSLSPISFGFVCPATASSKFNFRFWAYDVCWNIVL